ncbi:MAG: ABC transporter permease [Lachnospiraceae bacterium]|nr:ABC transporter permease [Lachnospiraceae bacterium]
MKVLWKCCLRSLKENKARTIVTIVGVALATALITALSCLGTSLLESMIQEAKRMEGNTHCIFRGVAYEDLKYFQNNQSIEKLSLEKHLGYVAMSSSNQYGGTLFYLDVCAAGQDWYEAEALELSMGRYPENEKEIVLARGIRSEMGIDVKIGDHVTLDIGKRYSNGQEVEMGVAIQDDETIADVEKREFEVVGFLKKDGMTLYSDRSGSLREEHRNVNAVQAYTYLNTENLTDGTYSVSVRYTKQGLYQRAKVDSALLGISEEYYTQVYRDFHSLTEDERYQVSRRVKVYSKYFQLASLEGFSPFHLTKDSVGVIALAELFFLIFVLAGVFCINNSFDISLHERVRQYGILSSVGTTKRQRRMIVWQEALVIGVIGIPVGVLLGIGLCFFLVQGTNVVIGLTMRNSSFVMVFSIAWWAVAIAAIQAMFMIALSAFESAVKASKISPIQAIRANEMIASKGKNKKTPKILKKLFGVGGSVAWQNFRRSKVKYRATIVSIVVSVSLLLGMSFLGMLFKTADEIYELEGRQYQIFVSVSNKEDYHVLTELARRSDVLAHKISWSPVAVTGEATGQNLNASWFVVFAMDDDSFAELCRENKIDPEKVKGKGLVTDVLENYSDGMILSGTYETYEQRINELPPSIVEVELAGIVVKGDALSDYYRYLEGKTCVYVGESWIIEHSELYTSGATGYYDCEDANKFMNDVLDMNLLNSRCYDSDAIHQENMFQKTLATMLLSGVLAVIILIGVTNVINAVSFNLELRSSEFAKLRAIGMTRNQFRRMIWMEGLFIDVKGLFGGTVIGCLISYALYRFCWETSDKSFTFAFRIPWIQILCSVIVVSALLFLIVESYGKKAMRRNVIETIRNENL